MSPRKFCEELKNDIKDQKDNWVYAMKENMVCNVTIKSDLFFHTEGDDGGPLNEESCTKDDNRREREKEEKIIIRQ